MAQDAEQEEIKPKKSSKKLIVMVVVLILIAGGGAAAWYFLMKPQKTVAHKVEEPKVEKPQPPVFVTLETFTVNLQPSPDTQYLQTDITLKVGSAETGELLKLHMPEVRNRLLLLLSSKKAADLLSLEGKQALSNEIIEQLKVPFNPGDKPQEILGVSFTSFVVQ